MFCREKPHDDEWSDLMKIKVPLLLNYAQCKLLKEDYYAVIVHCTDVLKFDSSELITHNSLCVSSQVFAPTFNTNGLKKYIFSDNVKALYRRAKANVGAWNPNEAKADFAKCLELDASLAKNIERDLKQLEQQIKEKDKNDKSRLQGMFQ